MSLDLFFAENPLMPASREKYKYLLNLFLQTIPDTSSCTTADVLTWLDATRWGSSNRYVAVCAIRKYIRWLHGPNHPALRIREKRKPSKPRTALKPAQIKQLVESFDTSTARGKRNLAIVCLAIDTGYRVAELASLKLKDIDFEERVCKVVVKGGEWGRGLFSEYTSAQLQNWIPHRKNGNPKLFQITRDGLRVTVRRWGEKLGFHLTPHMFKHTGATLATRQGAPTRVLQEAYRWKKIEMAENYTQDIEAEDFKHYFGTNVLL